MSTKFTSIHVRVALALKLISVLARPSSLKLHRGGRLQGMSEDVTISKFFDDPMLLELARQEADMSAGMGGYGY